MLIYFDCEFTNLYGHEGPIKLISAGFVTFDGREFYFELKDNFELNECSYFAEDVVLPHLNFAKHGRSSADAALELKAWIESFDYDDIALASDAPQYDFALIQELLEKHNCWPNNLSKEAVDLIVKFKNVQIDTRIEEFFTFQPMAIRHHALWDARALARACIKRS